MEKNVLKLFDLKKPIPRFAILAVLFLLSRLFEQAKPVPAALLTDAAVLQQQKPIPVCVKAAVGEKVTVGFAGDMRSAFADAQCRWLVTLDALPAGLNAIH